MNGRDTPYDIPSVRYPLIRRVGATKPIADAMNNVDLKVALTNLAYTGYFHIAHEDIDPGSFPPDWKAMNRPLAEGNLPGHAIQELSIAALATRMIWRPKKGFEHLPAITRYEYRKEKGQGHYEPSFQVLCFVKGLESSGPFVLSLKRHAVWEFMGISRAPGLWGTFYNNVVRAAGPTAEPYHYWLGLRHKTDKEGRPAFVEIGTEFKALVQPLDLGENMPKKRATPEILQALRVGEVPFKQFADIALSISEWAAAWDTIREPLLPDPDEEEAPTKVATPGFSPTFTSLQDELDEEKPTAEVDEYGVSDIPVSGEEYEPKPTNAEKLRSHITTQMGLHIRNNIHGPASVKQAAWLYRTFKDTFGPEGAEGAFWSFVGTSFESADPNYKLDFTGQDGKPRKYWGLHPDFGMACANALIDTLFIDTVDPANGKTSKSLSTNLAGTGLNLKQLVDEIRQRK